MDLWNPLPQFEATFYRRACPIPSGIIDPISSITYHNHILVGNHIWFIQKPLRSKDVGKHRLVLVQGTRRGRLQGLHLSNESVIQCGRQDQIYMTPLHYDVDTSTSAIISDSSVAMQSSSQSASSLATTAMWLQRLHQQLQQHPLPHKTSSNESNTTYYSIEISGMSLSTHSLEKWQLITLSAEVYIAWAEALLRARNIVNILEASGEWYKLQVLTKRMKECLVIRRRLSRFRFYDKSFIGVRAVKWLMEDKQCSRIQALAIGNRLLNLGFINHVNYEHLFYARHLLYQFADDILDSPFLPGSAGLLSNGNEPVVSNIHASTGKPRSMVAWAKQSIRSNATSSALQHQASNESNASSNAVNEQPVNQVPVEEYDILVDEHHRVLANYHQLQYDLILYQTHLKTVLQQVPSLHNVVSHHQHREQHQSQVVQEVFRRLCVLFLLLTLLWITTHEASSPTFAMQLETALQFVHGLLFIALVVLVALTLKMLYNEVFPSIATSEWTWKEHFQALISSVFKLKLSQSTVLPESIEIDKEWKQICKAFKHTEESYKMHQHNKATYSHMDVNVNEAGVEESNADADRSDEEEEETAVKAVTDEKRAHKKAMISEDDLLDEDEDEDDDDDDLEDDEAIIKHGIEQEEVLLDEDEDEDEDGDELGEGPDVDGDSDDENMTIISLDSYTLPNPSKKQGPSNAKHSSSSKSVVSRYLPSTNWPTYPLLLLRGGSHQVPTANTNVEKQQLLMQPLRLFDPSSTPEARPLKSEHAPMTLLVDIDSDHFVGRMFLTFCNLHPVQHTSSTSNHGTDSSGSPQKNNYHYRSVIQGRFKHPLPFAKVYTGQAFDEAIPHLPVHWLIRGISKLQPGSKSFLMGEKPYFISPLIATSQHVGK